MAGLNIFERYGIKEVANVYFQALEGNNDGIDTGDVVLYLDTLKVSTIEETADNVSAQGGWGNPKLVTWDYNKDIQVTLEDAVISWEEMRLLMGGKIQASGAGASAITVYKNAENLWAKNTSETGVNTFPTGDGHTSYGKNNFPVSAPTAYQWIDLTNGARGNQADFAAHVSSLCSNSQLVADTRIRYFWTESITSTVADESASEITISPERFPGTYRVVGDALIRSEKTGSDEAFQFVMNKAKILSNVTLTMQADGDPSTFSMTIQVLRDESGNMMSLKKYGNKAHA